MGGNYQKDLYKQLMEVMARVHSLNSSIPPSKDENTKPANAYNSRKPTPRKPWVQKGHKGIDLISHISGFITAIT